MVSFKILAGGYGTYVATYLFNFSDTTTPSLSVFARSPTGLNPSWISQHPTNSSILYAVNETPSGALQSFTINSNGTLSGPHDTIPTEGDLPAFALGLCTGQVGVMNYGTGNGRIIPTSNSSLIFSQDAPVITFPAAQGTVSHPHMILEHGDEILIPDLGQDTVWRMTTDGSNQDLFNIQSSIPQPPGSGPRHIAIFDDRLFTLHELSSTLTVQPISADLNAATPIISNVSILPPDPPQGASFAAAEILVPKPTTQFPVPYIYVSNRNLGTQDPRGDAIAIFELVNKGKRNETLNLVRHVYTGLDQIRGMEFGPAGEDEFLIAAGVAGSAGTIVLRRTEGGRNMEIVAKDAEIPTRSTFVWL